MIVQFNTERFNHVEQLSHYNYNIYELPYTISECLYLLIEWVDDSSTGEYHLGHISRDDGEFIVKHSFWGEMDGTVDLNSNRLD